MWGRRKQWVGRKAYSGQIVFLLPISGAWVSVRMVYLSGLLKPFTSMHASAPAITSDHKVQCWSQWKTDFIHTYMLSYTLCYRRRVVSVLAPRNIWTDARPAFWTIRLFINDTTRQEAKEQIGTDMYFSKCLYNRSSFDCARLVKFCVEFTNDRSKLFF